MDDTRSSSHAAGAVALVLALAATVAVAARTAAPAPVGAAIASQEYHLGGEYGLWVTQRPDSIIVQWLSDRHESGFIAVRDGTGRDILSHSTPPGPAHRAAFPAARRDSVVLRYGAGPDTFHTAVMLSAPERPDVVVSDVDSLFVVGDTHGFYDELVSGLAAAGLIDEQLRWSGGRSHLVFAGDLTDRGPDVLRLLWFVYRLEREAEQAGGRVHVLLGNHEVMVALGDLRYIHPKELHVAELHGAAYDHLFDTRASVIGRWLASRPAAIRVDRVLIAHGGIAPEYARSSIRAIDDTLRTYVGEELFHRWADTTAVIPMDSAAYERRVDFFWGPRSLFWHRGYVQSDSAGAELADVLRRWRADMLVVGHTAVPVIQARYDGSLIAAHTPRHGAELLLLVRQGRGYERYRISAHGPTERF